MKTSQYFWMQTLHQNPFPTLQMFVLEVLEIICCFNFISSDGISEEPRTLSKKSTKSFDAKYGLIVLHRDLSPEMAEKYKAVFQSLLGNPKKEGEKYYWLVPKKKRKSLDLVMLHFFLLAKIYLVLSVKWHKSRESSKDSYRVIRQLALRRSLVNVLHNPFVKGLQQVKYRFMS